MKKTVSTILVLLAATASSLASCPSPRPTRSAFKRQNGCILASVTFEPSSADLTAAIAQWENDVGVVNEFLDESHGLLSDPDLLLAGAQTALQMATDEPCQFATLKANTEGILSPQSFACAANDLGNVFGQVLSNLQTIIDDPSDTSAASDAVNAINNVRCCNVLPDLDILWQATEDGAGLNDQGLDRLAKRPQLCDGVACFYSAQPCEYVPGV